MGETPLIDALINRAVEVCKAQDEYIDPVGHQVFPMDAGKALVVALDEQIKDNKQAFALLRELVDNFDHELDYDNSGGDDLVDFVHSLVLYAPDHIVEHRVIEAVPDYKDLVRGRTAAIHSSC